MLSLYQFYEPSHSLLSDFWVGETLCQSFFYPWGLWACLVVSLVMHHVFLWNKTKYWLSLACSVSTVWSRWQIPWETRVFHTKLISLKMILVKRSALCIDSSGEKERLSFHFTLALHYPISLCPFFTISEVLLFSIVHIAVCVGKHWPWLIL